MRPTLSSKQGFSLVEALVAAFLVSSTVAGLAHLVASGMRQAAIARRAGIALQLAQSRLETLRSVPWSFDAAGARVSSPELAVSPDDALLVDLPGFVDALDAFGVSVPLASVGARAHLRRWRISWVGDEGSDLLLLQVCVVALGNGAGPSHRVPDACVSTIRGRQP